MKFNFVKKKKKKKKEEGKGRREIVSCMVIKISKEEKIYSSPYSSVSEFSRCIVPLNKVIQIHNASLKL